MPCFKFRSVQKFIIQANKFLKGDWLNEWFSFPWQPLRSCFHFQTRWWRNFQKSSSKKFKNSNKMLKTRKKTIFDGEARSTRARPREATKCNKSPHLTLRKNNFLASYYKQQEEYYTFFTRPSMEISTKTHLLE